MKKHKKILFNLLSITGILTISGTMISCNDKKLVDKKPTEPDKKDDNGKKDDKFDKNNPNGDDKGDGTNNELPTNPITVNENNIAENYEITNEYGAPLNYQSYSADGFIRNLNNNKLSINIKNNAPITFLNAIKGEDNTITLKFIKNGSESEFINHVLTGFKANSIEDEYANRQDKDKNFNIKEYAKLTQNERFKKDLESYITPLRANSSLRDLGYDNAKIESYNTKAKENNLIDYETANLLGQTMPKYDESGNFLGLDYKPIETGKGDNPIDNYGKDKYRNRGLARTITNETYSNISMQTYQFNIVNWTISPNENIRKAAQKVLQNDEDLTLLINEITDTNVRNEYLGKYSRNKDVEGVVKILIEDIFKVLVKQFNGDQVEASKVYTNYVVNQRNKIIERVNREPLFNEKIKNILIKRIKDTTDFYDLQNYWNTRNGSDGTAWIMDYELTTDGSYPKKWYFATNLHVLDGIDKDNFVSFGLTRLNRSTPSLYNKLKTNEFDPDKFTHFGFENTSALTRIFDGRDYLKINPNDVLANKSKDLQEFIDIAIFEIDFSKTNFTEDEVKNITNNYAELDDSKKASFANYDYLSNYEKINAPLKINSYDELKPYDSLYILGYPKTQAGTFLDYYLDKYADEHLLKNARWSFSLWTNASYDLYNKPAPNDEKTKWINDKGSYGLSYNIGYRTFTDKPGVIDQFISNPITGKNLYHSTVDNKDYISMNLAYLPKRYIPGGGASGSSVRNQNNEIVAIFHAANESASTGVAAALRSSGWNYNGLYGTYNLPQYDIIYGTGKDQKNSYREAMLNKRANIKTHLFKNGFSLENVEEKYKFKNQN